MRIEVLGPGCANCKALEAATGAALARLGMEYPIEKVADFPTIVSYGVMSTPALVIDGEVKVSGRVPTVADLQRLLAAHTTAA